MGHGPLLADPHSVARRRRASRARCSSPIPCIQSRHTCLGEFPSAVPILTRIQLKQLSDLLESESCRLCLLDEPKTAEVFGAVATDPIVTRWGPQQAATLVEADRLDSHPTSGGKLSNGQ